MKQILIIVAFLFTACYGQVRLFDAYDFTSGNYGLYFIKQWDTNHFERTDSLGRIVSLDSSGFYTKDIEILDRIRLDWVADTVNYLYSCGHDYLIYLEKDRSVVLTMLVNLECKEIIANGQPYQIQPELIQNTFALLRRLKVGSIKFTNLSEGKQF